MMKNPGLLIALLLCIAALCGCLSDSNEKETGNQNYTVQPDSETPAAGQQTKEQETKEQQEEQEEQQEKFERPVLSPADELPEGKEPVTEDISETPCADVPDEMSCLRDLAIKTEDTSYCEKLATGSVVDPRGRCIADVAKAKKDLSICDKLSGAKKLSFCFAKASGPIRWKPAKRPIITSMNVIKALYPVLCLIYFFDFMRSSFLQASLFYEIFTKRPLLINWR